MKKFLSILLSAVMVLSLAACGAKEATPNGDQSNTVNEDGTASSIASAGYDPNTDWVFGDQFNALPRAGQSADIWEKTKAKKARYCL